MEGARIRRPVRGDEALFSNLEIATRLLQDDRSRDALAIIHAAIVATSRERPLTRLEIRIRCISAPRPWRDLGISYSGWCRRRRKQRLTAERRAEAA